MPRLISDEDYALLQQLLRAFKKGRRETSLSSPQESDQGASQMYVALVPEEGIPGRSTPGTGTGTSSDVDLSTEVGHAECEVYHKNFDDLLTPVPGLIRRIHNSSSDDITGPQYIPVIKDAFGIWWALQGGQGGGGGSDCTVTFITEICQA